MSSFYALVLRSFYAGSFWEGRFRSIPLLDERAIVACMAYVDLNPWKAGMAQTLEESDYTSIQRRLRLIQEDHEAEAQSTEVEPALGPVFAKGNRRGTGPKLTTGLKGYVRLLHWTMAGKRKAELTTALMPGLKESDWKELVHGFMALFRSTAGSEASTRDYMQRVARLRMVDVRGRRLLYGTG